MKTCPICGKELKHQGALNIHTIHCERKQLKAAAGQQVQQRAACEHEYRLLSNNHSQELAAIKAGYGEVCKTCQELR